MEGPYRGGQPARAPYPEIGSDLSYRDHDAPVARMANRLLLDLVGEDASLLRVSGDGYAIRVGDSLRPHDVGSDDPDAARAVRARFALMAGLLPPEPRGDDVIPERARGWIRLAFAGEGGALREHDLRLWLRPADVAVLMPGSTPERPVAPTRAAREDAARIRELVASADRSLHVDGDLRGAAQRVRSALKGAALLGPEVANERVWAYEVRCRVAHAKGDLMEAADALERAVAALPDRPGTLHQRAALTLGRAEILGEAGALAQALELASAAHRMHVEAGGSELHPDAILALDVVAQIQEEAGAPEAPTTRAAVRRAAADTFGPADPLA